MIQIMLVAHDIHRIGEGTGEHFYFINELIFVRDAPDSKIISENAAEHTILFYYL